MSEGELRRLLADLGADLEGPPPDLARKAWAAAGTARLRRRAAVGAGVMVAAATVPVLFALRPPATTDGAAQFARSDGSGTSTAPTRAGAGAAEVLVHDAPPVAAEADLKAVVTPYSGLGEPRGVTPLSAAPVRRIVAATQAGVDRPIHLLADDGTWRILDAAVTPRPGGGNRAAALQVTSISPDARRLALPQPDALVVVDAGTGGPQAVRRFAVPGVHELVRWSADGRHVMVGGGEGAFLVDVASGGVRHAGDRAWDVIGVDADGVRELGPQGLRVLDPLGREVSRRPQPAGVERWWSAGWERSGRVARTACTTAAGLGTDEGIAVLDGGTGRMTHFLRLGVRSGRAPGQYAVLGWADDRTVLIGHSGRRVLAWDYAAGTLRRVAEVRAQVVALAPAT